MSAETENKSKPTQTLIALATCWGSKFGGINSFNSDLLSALGIAFYRNIRVLCIVLDAESTDAQKAANDHVEVISLGRSNDYDFSEELFSDIKDKLKLSGCVPNSETVWLGHDLITGGVAVKAAKETGGRSALIHHMSYAHYEAYAAGSRTASDKKTKQRNLFNQSDIILAVGPVLRDALEDLTERKTTMLVPGLPEITVSEAPKTFTAFLSGRISSDTHRIKQAHLGIAAFANATALSNSSAILPAVLNSKNNPCLKVRGLSEEGKSLPDGTDPENELKQFAEKYAKRVINLNALPFTTDRVEVFNELRRASVALMPSWHEGFGLVAWEAMAAGVPLILSENSGVYHLLEEIDNGVNKALVYPISVRGQVDEPFFHAEDLKEVSEAIIEIAKDPKTARSKAAQLRETLLQKGYTWSSCARQVVQALGWKRLDSMGSIASVSLPIAKKTDISTTPVSISDDLLDIPVPQWVSGKGLSSSQLLRAEEAVVPFDGDALPFLNDQVVWAEDKEYPIALRLLVGPGGAGKTRLALQLCSSLKARGWWAGFLRPGKNFPSQFKLITDKVKQNAHPSLIVIDYAEARTNDLLALLKPCLSLQKPVSLRVMLLARSSGEWWDSLEGADPQCEAFFAGRASSGPFVVPPLHTTQLSRATAFQQALQIFATKLCKTKPDHNPNLEAEYYIHPLMIQMAALLALHDEQAQSAEGLTRSLVNHERRYWGSLLDGSLATGEHAAQLMTLSGLFNGIQNVREIELIWKISGCGSSSELKVAFSHLHNLYPEKAGLQNLRPDLLGETLVCQVLLSRNGNAILGAVLARSDSRVRHHAWTILARILRHRADMIPLVQTVLVAHYLKNAKEAVEVCCQTPSPLPKIMELAFKELPESLQLQVGQQMASAFKQEQIPLSDLALQISEARLRQARRKCNKSSLSDCVALGRVMVTTSIDLKRCGCWNSALLLAAEAEEWFRGIAKTKPLHDVEWAMALTNCANRLSENGHNDKALIMAKQATDIYERKAMIEPDRFESELALALHNYASFLCNALESERALTVARKSNQIYERLSIKNALLYEPYLASGLNTLSALLAENGLYKEALETVKRAVSINERLAKTKPERFEPDWALSLNLYSAQLSEFGFSEDVLVAARKGEDILRRLAQTKPNRFAPDWANSLVNLCILLADGGRIDHALDSIKLAKKVYGEWAENYPLKYSVDNRFVIFCECFLRWLKSSSNQVLCLPGPRLESEVKIPADQWIGVDFYEFFVRACFSEDSKERIEYAQRSVSKWFELKLSVQRAYENCFFIVAAIIEDDLVSMSSRAVKSNWRSRYGEMLARRNGRAPSWLVTVATRLNLTLPVM